MSFVCSFHLYSWQSLTCDWPYMLFEIQGLMDGWGLLNSNRGIGTLENCYVPTLIFYLLYIFVYSIRKVKTWVSIVLKQIESWLNALWSHLRRTTWSIQCKTQCNLSKLSYCMLQDQNDPSGNQAMEHSRVGSSDEESEKALKKHRSDSC